MAAQWSKRPQQFLIKNFSRSSAKNYTGDIVISTGMTDQKYEDFILIIFQNVIRFSYYNAILLIPVHLKNVMLQLFQDMQNIVNPSPMLFLDIQVMT